MPFIEQRRASRPVHRVWLSWLGYPADWNYATRHCIGDPAEEMIVKEQVVDCNSAACKSKGPSTQRVPELLVRACAARWGTAPEPVRRPVPLSCIRSSRVTKERRK